MEYIKVYLDGNDMTPVNRLAAEGWRVQHIAPAGLDCYNVFMERETGVGPNEKKVTKPKESK
jgi:hypothetical protein